MTLAEINELVAVLQEMGLTQREIEAIISTIEMDVSYEEGLSHC